VLNAVLVVLTQKAQKILKEVCGNFANKKPTLLGIGFLFFNLNDIILVFL
jgi:hypothetical protein